MTSKPYAELKEEALVLYTGKGGVKQFIVSFLEVAGIQVTWRSFRTTYVFLRATQQIEKHGGLYRIA